MFRNFQCYSHESVPHLISRFVKTFGASSMFTVGVAAHPNIDNVAVLVLIRRSQTLNTEEGYKYKTGYLDLTSMDSCCPLSKK